MAINFPDSPSVNDTHTVGDRTWVWDGTVWSVVVGSIPTTITELTINDDLTVDTSTLHVDSANNRVGVGTTSPDDSLHVVGDVTIEVSDDGSAAQPEVTLHRGSTTPADGDYLGQFKFAGKNDAGQTVNYAKITGKISDVTDTTEDGLIEIATVKAGSQNIGYRLTSTDLKLINGTGLQVDGNVGIGTTTPSYPLSFGAPADGSQQIALYESGLAGYGIGTDQNRVTIFAANTGTYVERMVVRGDTGNVGIGTQSPANRLHIKDDSYGLLALDRTANANVDQQVVLAPTWNGANNTALDFIIGSTIMRLTEEGNAGIGTTSPNQKLDVDGALAVRGKMVMGASTFIQEPWAGSTIAFQSYGSIGTQGSYRASWAWNYERGTDSGWHALGVNSFTSAGGIDIGNDGILFRHDASYGATAPPTTRMIMKPDGTVGIGTASPAGNFQVVSQNRAVTVQDSGYTNYAELGYTSSGATSPAFGLFTGYTIIVKTGTTRAGLADTAIFYSNGNFNLPRGVIESDGTYSNTTGSGANMHISSGGYLYRSTSSSKYKTQVETMEDSYADSILGLRPVWYRSLSEHDPDSWGYWGFIAEEVAEVDPRLVNFGVPADYEWQHDEEGQKIAPDVADLTEPEGVQYDRLVPHLVNLAKRQQTQIDALTAENAALTTRIEALEAN